ncbi:HNH endonuclease [Caenimonas sp. DR4.4]|uniref:HNH endonuclease n=1 Tax=Caenimonas aquaedulcis TaxID=2793270 RepID=A0A931H6F3_9BURK|nr:HNH endonuclease [Caenimonas aquaedulcis]
MVLLATTLAAQPIERSHAEVRAFRAVHPCPATGRSSGACPGWAVDHVRPLCYGGEDKPHNMQWISDEDHKWKTFIDVRECRKMKRLAGTPARESVPAAD